MLWVLRTRVEKHRSRRSIGGGMLLLVEAGLYLAGVSPMTCGGCGVFQGRTAVSCRTCWLTCVKPRICRPSSRRWLLPSGPACPASTSIRWEAPTRVFLTHSPEQRCFHAAQRAFSRCGAHTMGRREEWLYNRKNHRQLRFITKQTHARTDKKMTQTHVWDHARLEMLLKL